MLLVLFFALAAADNDDTFGGATSTAPSMASSPALDEDVCTIKGDDGVWRSCADALALKNVKAAPTDEALVDMSPEAKALRAKMQAADAAAKAPPPPPPKTQLEKELEKARLDPTLPLLALRIDVARVQEEIARLEKAGTGGRAKEEAELRLVEVTRTLDAVERIAIHRMDVCSQRRGNKPIVKNFRMTAGGPVLLTASDMMAQLPIVDPEGCERIFLVDAEVVARVKRREELTRTLATKTFGYHEVAQRKALEKELSDIDKALAREAIPALSAPGVRDPYGGR